MYDALQPGLSTLSANRRPRTDESLAGRVEIVLLTTDGFDFRRINVEAFDGAVTLRGDVGTDQEKHKADHAARRVDGVNDVNNLLKVVHEGQ